MIWGSEGHNGNSSFRGEDIHVQYSESRWAQNF